MAHPEYAKEVYEYLKGCHTKPELETITRLAEEPEILALVDIHGSDKLKDIAKTIREIQKENKYQRGYRKVTLKQRIAIANGLLSVILFDDLMSAAYGIIGSEQEQVTLETEVIEGIEISQTHNVGFFMTVTATVGKGTSDDINGNTYRASVAAVNAINNRKFGEPSVFTVDIDGELIVVTTDEAEKLGKDEVPAKWWPSKINYLTTKTLAQKAGVVPSRIRQRAESIPGSEKTETGWRFPNSAINYVKNLRGPGRPSK